MRKLVLLPICLGAYFVWPYVALYRLDIALQRGDARALAAAIDWDAVREGLKEDIADGIMGTDPAATAAAEDVSTDALPPFGASFVKGMAGNAVDRMITPERLAAAFRSSGRPQAPMSSAPSFTSFTAWFDSPTRFEARLRCGAAANPSSSLRLQLDLVRSGWGWQWRITRASIPTELFTELGSDRKLSQPTSRKVFAGQ